MPVITRLAASVSTRLAASVITRLAASVGAALLASVTLAPVVGVTLTPVAAAEPPNRTPDPAEVLNSFVEGALAAGRPANPAEAITPLVTIAPFYAEPALTGEETPGTLLKAEKIDVQFAGFRPGNLDAYRLMYVTTTIDGELDISTGITLIPVDGRPDAERRVVSYQMANDGVGPNCHPSAMWTGSDPVDTASWSAVGPLAQMLGQGYAVVMSDVGNNGDLSPRGVFAGKYNARTNLDALRAALDPELTGLSRDAPIGMFGIAGGGVGTGHAVEIMDWYAPELTITAAVMEGMVPDYRSFMELADGTMGSGFAFATLLGLEPHYPEMRVDEHLNPAGRAIADDYRTQCQFPAYYAMPFVPLSTLFLDGRVPAEIEAFQRAFEDNLMGYAAPSRDVRVLVASCAADDSFMSIVPAEDSRTLVRQWREQGGTVDYQPTDCSMERLVTDPWGWTTDLYGMQTMDWLDAHLGR